MTPTAAPPPAPASSAARAFSSAFGGRLHYWAVAIGQFASIQIVIQVIGFGAGILIVRNMPQREYAFYTIANSMQGTMSLVADIGISSAVMAMGGRVWQDRRLLGRVIRSGLQLRYRLAVAGALVVSPFMIFLLMREGAGVGYALVLLALVLAALAFQLTSSILGVLPRLHAQIKRVQYLDLASSVVRAGFLGMACLIFFNSAVALLLTLPSVVFQFVFLRRWAAELMDVTEEATAEYRAEIMKVIRSLAPNAVFYFFQGQIGVWLIGIFGKAEGVAQVGALGRLGMLFGIVSSVMATVIIPRFARCQDVGLLRRRYIQIVGFCGFVAAVLVGGAMLFTRQFLWLLGKQYGNLHAEFLLMVLSSVTNFIVATMWSLNASKAWVGLSWLYIPITLVSDAILLPLLNLSTVSGVLLFSWLPQIPLFGLQVLLASAGLRKERAFAER